MTNRQMAVEYADEMTKNYDKPDRTGMGIVLAWNEYFWSKFDELQTAQGLELELA